VSPIQEKPKNPFLHPKEQINSNILTLILNNVNLQIKIIQVKYNHVPVYPYKNKNNNNYQKVIVAVNHKNKTQKPSNLI
jgi:hypothetical protein